jgi:7,8-dihydroneopterin aldolase/epimerase/oxygenase
LDVSDQISLTGLRAFGRHGVFESERRDGQEFAVDLVLDLDTRAAAASDDVADTVHYGELAEQVAAIVSGEPVDLLETLAARIAAHVLGFSLVTAVQVTVHKPSAPIPVPFGDVAVTIRRTR